MRNLRLIVLSLIFAAITISLKAQSGQEPLFTFGVIADVQYADIPDAGTRHYRKSPAKLAEAVAHFNMAEVGFVFSLGDFINDNIKGFDTLNSITSRLSMPLYHVAGNHDFDPAFPGIKATIDRMALKRLNYTFSNQEWRFIILNGNDISLYTNKKGSAGYRKAEAMLGELKAQGLPQAQPWNGAIGTRQLKWLEKELYKAEMNGERVILACHFPIQSAKREGRLWNSNEVNTLISRYPNVFAFFAGHGHISQHLPVNGIHHIMFRGIVEESDNAWAIVSVFSDHIVIEGFGKEVSRKLD
jgi:manganese-dependent ADP-ribose/CDP-alcohol diphosphatase